MSKAPGKIERAIEAILTASDREYTARELNDIVYLGGMHETTIRTALNRLHQRGVVDRVRWYRKPGIEYAWRRRTKHVAIPNL